MFKFQLNEVSCKLGGQCKDSVYEASCGRGEVEICRGGIECDPYKERFGKTVRMETLQAAGV